MQPLILLSNGKRVKLGRIRPQAIATHGRFKIVLLPDGRVRIVPRLAAYVKPMEYDAPLPDTLDLMTKAAMSIARMYLNDQEGDCVIAGKYHQLGIWSANDTPLTVVATDKEVQNSYQTVCGRGDNGCNITDVLDYFQRNGLIATGVNHKIDGYVSVDHTNQDLVKTAIYLFGGLTLGINLPQAWTKAPGIWDVTNTRIVGGHDVCVGGYTAHGVQIATWGQICTITWPALTNSQWVEECYAELSPDWYNSDKLSPFGIDVDTLKADLAAIAAGQIPIIPDPNPVPVPVPVPPIPPGPTPASLPPAVVFLRSFLADVQSINNCPSYVTKTADYVRQLLYVGGYGD